MYHRLILTLALLLSLVLSACGQPTGGTDTTESPATSPAAASPATSPAASPAAASPAAASPATESPAVASPAAGSPAASPAASPAGSAAPVPSGSPVTSLEPIRQRGQLIAGVKYDQPLFGYLNPLTNELEGFDIEIAREVANQIFGDPNAIEFREAISANRIPYLQNGVVDIVAATMTANAERAEQIDFSDVYYVAGQSLLVRTDSDIQSIEDLAGRTVGTARGSTSERNIREHAPEAQVELFDTYADAVQALQANRLDAVTTDDIILYGFQESNPEQLKVVGGQFTQEPYAIGVAKGNEELLNEVNTALRNIKESGRWAEIYQQFIPTEEEPELPPQNWQDVGN